MKPILMLMILGFAITLKAEIPERANVSNFAQIWRLISEKNPDLKALEQEKKASIAKAEAASSALMPTVYLSGQSIATDNPTIKFMGIMNQRDISQNDFMPQNLANYDWQIVHQYAVGVQMPIYEGGGSHARSAAFNSAAEAKEWQSLATKNHLYFRAASSYGLLIILQNQKKAIKVLNERIQGLIGKYRLGNKNNPLGYSGLLGLKNLIIQLEGADTQITAERQIHIGTLKTLSGTAENIEVGEGDKLDAFLNNHLNIKRSSPDSLPPSAMAMKKASEAAQAEVDVVNAMYKPQFSAFAETGATAGVRDIEPSSTFGLALSWTLYDASKNSRQNAGRDSAAALSFKSDGEMLKVQLETEEINQRLISLKTGENLLKSSEMILEDQIKVTLNLFHSGVVNVLPVVDIFSHKVELLKKQFETEKQLLQTQANLWLVNAR